MLNFNIKRITLITSFLVVFIALTNNGKAQAQKPNIILILADDIGYTSLTCNGGNLYSTPSIDKLAQKGMRFTQCHASPTCSPSRFLLLTGKYNFRNYTEWGTMNINEKTIGNMLKNAGYKTGCFGKWQLNGGDAAIRAFGFDNYLVHCPFTAKTSGNKYKSPHLYSNGNFIDDSLTTNKYSEDILTDSVINFIKTNKNKPFFIYFPMNLVHMPFSPTPDDSEFKTWPEGKDQFDTTFFPSMMTYMDKKIGDIIHTLKQTGIDSNTIIIFTADNGTPHNVADYANEEGSHIKGEKSKTIERGLHVPLIIKWPGVIAEASVNNDLIGFTDFLSTLADIANIPVPDYGPLDGVSFAQRLTGGNGNPRETLFYHYEPHPEDNSSLTRWAQTTQYKLYDTSAANNERLFFDIVKDEKEKNPIPDSLMTPQQAIIKKQLREVIKGYILQGKPILSSPELLLITDTSAKIIDSIKIDGGSTITASGVVWGTNHKPVLADGNYTSDAAIDDVFYSFITGLKANTTYYARSYATNIAGTKYSEEIVFTTPAAAPIALPATQISQAGFTANWSPVSGAKNYRIDVSTLPSFSTSARYSSIEGFDNGNIEPTGWYFSDGIETNTERFGKKAPALQLGKNKKQRISTSVFPGYATRLSFWIKRLKNNAGSLLVEGFDGIIWTTIENITDIPKTATIKIYDTASSPLFKNGFTRFRFIYTKNSGEMVFDDVRVNYTVINPSFVAGYQDSLVKANSLKISGLNKNTNYYYRIRAQNKIGTSNNSNIIEVVTGSVVNKGEPCEEKNKAFNVKIYPNPADNQFNLTIEACNNKPVQVIITDLYGKTMYLSGNNDNNINKYVFGKNFKAGTYFVHVIQNDTREVFKIIKLTR